MEYVELITPEELRAAKIAKGLSLAQIAESAGCSKALIGHLLTGTTRKTNIVRARRIALALGVPVHSLFRVIDVVPR